MKPFKEFYKGNAFTGTVWYAPRSDGPANLLGYTATSKVKDSSGARHSATCTIAPDGLSVEVTIPASDTAKFVNGLASWNVKFQFGDDETTTFSTGVWQFEVKDQPTN